MEHTEVNPSSPREPEFTGRTADGRFAHGGNHNPGGRPRNTMKDYVARKFSKMTDDEKEAWLTENKVSAEIIWKMGEGNPDNKSDITSGDEKISAGIIILPSKNDTEPQ